MAVQKDKEEITGQTSKYKYNTIQKGGENKLLLLTSHQSRRELLEFTEQKSSIIKEWHLKAGEEHYKILIAQRKEYIISEMEIKGTKKQPGD